MFTLFYIFYIYNFKVNTRFALNKFILIITFYMYITFYAFHGYHDYKVLGFVFLASAIVRAEISINFTVAVFSFIFVIVVYYGTM